jgi:electron transfer flavoprotein alpha subunit
VPPALTPTSPPAPAPQLSSLVVAEQKQGALQPSTLHVVAAASALRGPISVLVAGHEVQAAADAVSGLQGVERVLLADDPSLAHCLAEPMAALIADLGKR